MRERCARRWWTGLVAGAALAGTCAAQQSPESLLGVIGEAVNRVSYSGTLIRSVDGRIDTMRVMRSNEGGIVREKLVSLDGEGREIIRNGSELICLLPGRQIKLVDTQAPEAGSLLRLPADASELNRFYTLEALGKTRVAGRMARAFFVRPRDRYRYGHRIWVDAETMLPLRMQLVGPTRRVVEEILFTDIVIGIDIPADRFVSDIDSSGYRVIRADQTADDKLAATTGSVATGGTPSPAERPVGNWPSEPSPGFRLRASQTQTVRINGRVAQRFVFSDGLATVSMFIAPGRAPASDPDAASTTEADGATQVTRSGAATSYQRRIGDKTMTLVGEVPEETLRLLAERAERELLSGAGSEAE